MTSHPDEPLTLDQERAIIADLDRQNLEALAALAPRMQAALDHLLGKDQS